MDGYQVAARVEIEAAPDRHALLVVGMSRSGTLVLTRMLHEALRPWGLACPSDLLGAGHGNPVGHFESRAIVDLNDAILGALGRSSSVARPLVPFPPGL